LLCIDQLKVMQGKMCFSFDDTWSKNCSCRISVVLISHLRTLNPSRVLKLVVMVASAKKVAARRAVGWQIIKN
jgi:hypothetical protein